MVPLFNSIPKESIHLSKNQNYFYIVWMDGGDEEDSKGWLCT